MSKTFKWHDSIAMRADQAKNHAFISQVEALQAVKDREELIRDYQDLKMRYIEIGLSLNRWDPEAFRDDVQEILDRD